MTGPGYVSVYLSRETIEEIESESKRTGMTMSALVRKAWYAAREDIAKLGTVSEVPD